MFSQPKTTNRSILLLFVAILSGFLTAVPVPVPMWNTVTERGIIYRDRYRAGRTRSTDYDWLDGILCDARSL